MTAPSIWGSGIKWGSFKWGATATVTGRPKLYASLDGEALDIESGSWQLGRSDWFDVLTPSNASVTIVGEVAVEPNQRLLITTDNGALWQGYTDDSTVVKAAGQATRTTITATDPIGRLGQSVRAPGRVEASGDLVARFFNVGSIKDPLVTYGDLVDVIEGYLTEYAPDLAIDVTEGDSTGTLPTLTDWFFDAPGQMPRKTILEIINKAEETSNAMVTLTRTGDLLVVMRAALAASSVTITDLDGEQASWSVTRGRTMVINHWLFERPAYNDTTVGEYSDTTSIGAYGERTYEVQDYLCTTDSHFDVGLRTALSLPRSQVPDAVFPISDLTDPALLVQPLDWVTLDGDTYQVMNVSHAATLSGWTVTLALDASQNSLNGVAEPTPA